MSKIHIQRRHNLGTAEARAMVEDIARQMKSRLQIEYRWNGDQLLFDRPGAKGSIAVTESLVMVDIELGLMLTAFKGMVEDQINGYLDQKIGAA
jgi:putative polyhydroxyalkanoate system protein